MTSVHVYRYAACMHACIHVLHVHRCTSVCMRSWIYNIARGQYIAIAACPETLVGVPAEHPCMLCLLVLPAANLQFPYQTHSTVVFVSSEMGARTHWPCTHLGAAISHVLGRALQFKAQPASPSQAGKWVLLLVQSQRRCQAAPHSTWLVSNKRMR